MLTPCIFGNVAYKACYQDSIKHKSISKLATRQIGASMVEFVVVAPVVLMMILGVMQTGMVFFAKSNTNYAAFEASRAGSVEHASLSSIRNTFTRAMVGYYGGGRNAKELATSLAKATADITPTTMKVELLSPTKESFDDYASPRLSKQLGTIARVIPNNNLSAITCPVDKPSCNNNPNNNHSGQTLSDANLLHIRITYGIPAVKQMPIVGKFYIKVLQGLYSITASSPETDPFKKALLAQGRIPVVVHTTMRMQSEPIENGNISNPGPGNNGTPTDPGPSTGGSGGENTPPCVGTACTDDGGGASNPSCDPTVDVDCGQKPDPCAPNVVSEDLSSDVLFGFDSAILKPAGKSELDKLIQELNTTKADTYRISQIFITGYADKIGDPAFNLKLSQQRAQAVEEYIQKHLDADVTVDINTEGKGELDPKTSDGVCTEVKTAENIANCAPDRRVNITRVYKTF